MNTYWLAGRRGDAETMRACKELRQETRQLLSLEGVSTLRYPEKKPFPKDIFSFEDDSIVSRLFGFVLFLQFILHTDLLRFRHFSFVGYF